MPGQPGLSSEFQAGQHYIVRPVSEKFLSRTRLELPLISSLFSTRDEFNTLREVKSSS